MRHEKQDNFDDLMGENFDNCKRQKSNSLPARSSLVNKDFDSSRSHSGLEFKESQKSSNSTQKQFLIDKILKAKHSNQHSSQDLQKDDEL